MKQPLDNKYSRYGAIYFKVAGFLVLPIVIVFAFYPDNPIIPFLFGGLTGILIAGIIAMIIGINKKERIDGR